MSSTARIHHARLLKTATDKDGQQWDHYAAFVTPHIGSTMLVIRTIRDDWPPELKDAWTVANQAVLSGQCSQCRARTQLLHLPAGSKIVVDHADDCDGNESWAMGLLEGWLADQRVCPHGDPTCPCPDGDLCHYEGDDPLPCSHCEEE